MLVWIISRHSRNGTNQVFFALYLSVSLQSLVCSSKTFCQVFLSVTQTESRLCCSNDVEPLTLVIDTLEEMKLVCSELLYMLALPNLIIHYKM